MKYITAEGPSTEFSYLTRNGKLDVFIPRPTGHTYPAPHEPVRFVPFDPEITERAVRNAFEPLIAMYRKHYRSSKKEIHQLRTQLDTARKALEEIRDTKINYYNPDDIWIRSLDMKTYAREALAQIEAGQKGEK